MTRVIKVRNVNDALPEAVWWLKTAGIQEHSRNGPVLVAPGPVVTEYTHPTERVLWLKDRDANPVFHLLEALWMLAGEDAVDFLLPYNARMAEYAETDGYIHGAYGARWRRTLGMDQLIALIYELRKDKTTRQAVLQMWSSQADLGVQKRDRPCNTHAYFDCRGGVLNMTVCCRSNDMLWGAYGANVVHFSILQEVIAHAVGVPVGVYRQFSNNFHAYTDLPIVKKWLDNPSFAEPEPRDCPTTVPILSGSESIQDLFTDCAALVQGNPLGVWHTSFFHRVVAPLKRGYDMRKQGSRTWKAHTLTVVPYRD